MTFSTAGFNIGLGSRLLGRGVLEGDYEKIAETFVEGSINVNWA